MCWHSGRGTSDWPPAELSVVTPGLTLRYISDELAVELAHLAAAGIHDPAMQPFFRTLDRCAVTTAGTEHAALLLEVSR